ncbi:acetyltransferase [Paenibacillus sp. RRE4]|uniref:acetyltransferase n=1 Tax=Paenibacillus sp. RRE4 TaxID=2962587 RepID=UPI00288148E3|nr:acetyltransferase [Paenibacillus sp. RRE4]MDT0126205.1 acetyltransferase [Paenibacillus sp. RRE4]
MASNKILLIGGGGHCKSVLDSLIGLNLYSDIAIIDKRENVGKNILDVPIIGTDEDLEEFINKGFHSAFVTVGSVGNPEPRIKLHQLITAFGFHIPVIVDKSAVIGSDTKFGEGVFVGKRAIVNAGSVINSCAILNSGAIIEHDCNVGKYAHIASGVVLAGGVNIGNNAHIGAQTVIRQNLSIGEGTTIGIGSVVVKNIANKVVAYGNPCEVVR